MVADNKIIRQEEIWTETTERYAISAKEYFCVLGLAIYHVDGAETKSSYEVTQHHTSAEAYKCATDILNAMYKEKGG